MEASAAPAPDRSRRVYAWWGVGFAFLAVLGLFWLLVIRPVTEVRRAAEGLLAAPMDGYFPEKASVEAAVAGLGGPEAAARKISLYLQVPDRLVGDWHYRWTAGAILGCCGKPGLKVLRDLVKSPREDRNKYGSWGAMAFSWYYRDQASRAECDHDDMEAPLKDADPEVVGLVGEISAVMKAKRLPAVR